MKARTEDVQEPGGSWVLQSRLPSKITRDVRFIQGHFCTSNLITPTFCLSSMCTPLTHRPKFSGATTVFLTLARFLPSCRLSTDLRLYSALLWL